MTVEQLLKQDAVSYYCMGFITDISNISVSSIVAVYNLKLWVGIRFVYVKINLQSNNRLLLLFIQY